MAIYVFLLRIILIIQISFNSNDTNFFSVSHGAAVNEEGEAAPLVVALAVLIPDDGECVASVADAVEAKVRPSVLGDKGIGYDAAVGLGTEAADAGDDEVVVGGVVVVAAALTVAHEPGTRLLVEVLTDVGAAAVVLALGVELHLLIK